MLFLLAISAAFASFDDDLCAGLDGNRLERCETKRRGRVDNLRASTVAFLPSQLHDSLTGMDRENPFDSDRFYLGTVETGIDEVDNVLTEVVRVQAAVRMARYVGALYAEGEVDMARQYATPTLQALISLKDTRANLLEDISGLRTVKPRDLIKGDNPRDPQALLEAGKSITQIARVTAQTTRAFADLPGAIAALRPIIKDGDLDLDLSVGALSNVSVIGDNLDRINQARDIVQEQRERRSERRAEQ